MSLVGKQTKEVVIGSSNYFTGINPALFKGIKEITFKDKETQESKSSYVLEFAVIDKDGKIAERFESIYVLTKDDQINVAVINSLLTALGVPEEGLLAEGAVFTQEMNDWIQSQVDSPVGLLLYKQKAEKDEYGYFHTNKNGSFKGHNSINPASMAGTEIDIGEQVSKGGKKSDAGKKETAAADKPLR